MKMMLSDTPQATRRGRWIPWTFVAFFAVVFAVNAAMVTLAFRSWTGLASDDAYGQGLRYGETLADARAQRELGWSADLRLRSLSAQAVDAHLRLVDAAGKAIAGAEVVATFWRPVHDGSDMVVRLTPRAPGDYAAHAHLPLPGQWEVRIAATRGGDSVRLVRRISVP